MKTPTEHSRRDIAVVNADEYDAFLADANKLFVDLSTARAALELVLLFHNAQPWNEKKVRRWTEITGSTEATTKVMCDHIRKVLG